MAAPSQDSKPSVVVVGGGIIGLTTAYELSKHFSVHVVEKRDKPGCFLSEWWGSEC